MSASENRAIVLLRGIALATLFVTLWVWVATLVRRLDPAIGMVPPEWLRPVGWALALAGFALGLSCVGLFLTTGRGTPAPFDPPRVFVASGPYKYFRNPMYVGAILAFIGGGLIVRSIEEPALDRRFGESYAQYKQQVNRWLPRLSRRTRGRAA